MSTQLDITEYIHIGNSLIKRERIDIYENNRLVKSQPVCSLDKDESSIKIAMGDFLAQSKRDNLDDDYEERQDDEWVNKANEWRQINQSIKQLQILEKTCRDQLIDMAQDKNIAGAGIKLSKQYRKGLIDYSIIPQLMGIDLEQYRKQSIEYWKIC